MQPNQVEENVHAGLWIPRQLLQDKNLNPNQKMIFATILHLHNGKGCTAGNQHIASFFDLSKGTTANIISQLSKKGYLSIFLHYKKDSKEVEFRTITPLHYTVNTPLHYSVNTHSSNSEGYNKIDRQIDIKEIKKKKGKEKNPLKAEVSLNRKQVFKTKEKSSAKKEKFREATEKIEVPWDKKMREEFIEYYTEEDFNSGTVIFEKFETFNLKSKAFAWIRNQKERKPVQGTDDIREALDKAEIPKLKA